MKVLAFSLLLLSAAVSKSVVDTNANFDFSKFISQMVKNINNPDAERSNGTKPNQTKLSQGATVTSRQICWPNPCVSMLSFVIFQIFEEMDHDDDGYISAAEFLSFDPSKEWCPGDMEKCIQQLIEEVDINGDGQADYKEFVLMFEE